MGKIFKRREKMGKKSILTLLFVFLHSTSLFSITFRLERTSDYSIYVSLTSKSGIVLSVKSNRKIRVSTVLKKIADSSYYSKLLRINGKYSSKIYLRYEYLNDEYKKAVLKKLFPGDYFKEGYYVHKVKYSGKESLWRVAVWFTGNGANYKEIRRINGLKTNKLPVNFRIRIPESMLFPFLKPQTAKKSVRKNILEYGKDKQGEYAIYRLKKGEALYSSVVVRFTGRLDAESVMELAYEIARRSGIKDVTDIPVGYPVKIPLKYLLPEYLPEHSEKYKKYEKDLKESEILASMEKIEKTPNLEGVFVILDSGHGGSDTGAMYNGVWEDDYMYDIMCRVKRILESETKAFVYHTVYDKSSKFKVFNKKKLKLDRDEYLLTSPRLFPLKSKNVSKAGVNLRWYIANHINSTLITKKGVPPSKIVFISLHADALYKKVRGAMVYIPYAGLYRKKAAYKPHIYRNKYNEVKTCPVYYFSKKEVQISEGLSRKMAKILIKKLKENRIPVHKDKPVREFIFRSRYSRPFVPAVLRYNKVRVKMLIEVANLKNRKDAKNVKKPSFREKFAKSIVEALKEFYSK